MRFKLVLLVLLSVSLLGFNVNIDTPYPGESPLHIPLGGNVTYTGQVFEGGTYTYLWSFCSAGECSLTSSSDEDPDVVTYFEPGVFLTRLIATNSTGSTDQVNFTVVVESARIISPLNDSNFPTNHSISFIANASTDLSSDVTYTWFFGDGNFTVDAGVPPGTISNVTHVYNETGLYQVSLLVEQSGVTDYDEINVFAMEEWDTNLSCRLGILGCDEDEFEYLRLASRENTHARGFNDENYYDYDYPVCCKNKLVNPEVSQSSSNPGATYAVLDNDSSVPLSGAHYATGNPETEHYHFKSYYGAGTICANTTTFDCSLLPGDKICMFELLDEELPGGGYHFAECGNDDSSSTQCCEIAEVCTDNIDNNDNNWTDTADSDWRTGKIACPEGSVCAISDAKLFPECSWLNDYCDNQTGNCDYRNLGVPTGFQSFGPGYYVMEDYFNSSCDYWEDPNGVVNPLLPTCSELRLNLTANFNTTKEAYNVTVFELMHRCRFLHCSAGEFPDTNPLPVWDEDMINNGNATRHVCEIGKFWDPKLSLCRESEECYDPGNPANPTTLCKYDFLGNSSFGSWVNDSYPLDNAIDKDCFETNPFGENIQACCPVFEENENTYNYEVIKFYIA